MLRDPEGSLPFLSTYLHQGVTGEKGRVLKGLRTQQEQGDNQGASWPPLGSSPIPVPLCLDPSVPIESPWVSGVGGILLGGGWSPTRAPSWIRIGASTWPSASLHPTNPAAQPPACPMDLTGKVP